MKILSAEQLKLLDKSIIEKEGISSLDLMERAAESCFELIEPMGLSFVFCGKGNNGGDGLACARMLLENGEECRVFIVEHSPKASKEFLSNLKRLEKLTKVSYIKTAAQIPKIKRSDNIIDAIFGTGLSRPVEGIAAEVIKAINKSKADIYSIDMPSGLYCDRANTAKDNIVQAQTILTIHAPKLSFFFPSNEKYVGEYEVCEITEKQYPIPADKYIITEAFIQSFIKNREKFSHKGDYGHALVAAGSFGKIGAAVLAVKAALRSGAGLVSSLLPACGYDIMQSTNPEAMVVTSGDSHLFNVPDTSAFDVLAVGPGLGVTTETIAFIYDLLKSSKRPMVIDADALNIIAAHKTYAELIPAGSVLTPHPGEFKRMAGEWKDDADKYEKQIAFSKKYKVVIVLKGAHTSVSTPEGDLYFNTNGNAGMAKGGSGDVLTGIIVSLMAQKYTPVQAALLGVFAHGFAGDLAMDELGRTAMKAGDIIYYLPKAFQHIEGRWGDSYE